MQEPNREQIAMLLDVSFCMSIFNMTVLYGDIEIDMFFQAIKERLKLQNFKKKDIDEVLVEIKDAMKLLKKGFVEFNAGTTSQ